MAPSARQLDAMGLSPPAQNDEIITHSGRRLHYQDAVKATNHAGRPTGDDLFNTTRNTNGSAARCNMPCQMITCSATIIGGGAAGANKVLTGETYYMKKEGKTWIEKNLTWNKGDNKDTKNLSLASRPNSYSINKYYEYIPTIMRNSPDYKNCVF